MVNGIKGWFKIAKNHPVELQHFEKSLSWMNELKYFENFTLIGRWRVAATLQKINNRVATKIS